MQRELGLTCCAICASRLALTAGTTASSSRCRAMEDERARLLAQAERCRRLAASITDPETVERLTGLAEECERKAAGMSSATDEDKRGGP